MKLIRTSLFALVAVAAAANSAHAAEAAGETLPTIDSRFAGELEAIEEEPSFQRHVLPLMGRLGCNGSDCPGSLKGRGDFSLSLFGYDFKAEHEDLLAGEREKRVNVEEPEWSLILVKPTDASEHEGGKRYPKNGWEYNVFRKWIEKGAKDDSEEHPSLAGLEVTPSEIQLKADGEAVQLRAVAVWSNGVREDVTPLCRFQTNDNAVAEVSETGVVTGMGLGDTHIVVFYDNGITPVPVLRPVSPETAAKYPKVPTPTKIDELVVEKLKKLGVVPSPLADDAEFLRRVTLDITGTLPTSGQATAFLADTSVDKRARKIDELLDTAAYAGWWSTRLCDITGNSAQQSGNNTFRNEESRQWYEWVEDRIARNVPYDEIVEGFVLANGRLEGQSYEEYCKYTGQFFRDKDPVSFAEHPSVPQFWSRRNMRMPEQKALAFSYAFLGVRLECAQCHKHPFDQWSQYDFEHFQAFFNGIQYGTRQEDREAEQKLQNQLGLKGKPNNEVRRSLPEMLNKGKIVPFTELYVNARPTTNRGNNNSSRGSSRVITPKLLGGEEVVANQYGDPREALMEWLRDPENPYFARAMVNRVWTNYFGVGIVDPPDDQNLANPPSNAPLLVWLTKEFVASGYDLKWLHRTICNSRTYQLSWEVNETNRLDRKNFSHAVPRRLPAEVVIDALDQATASDEVCAEFFNNVEQRSIGPTSSQVGIRNSRGSYALIAFGKPLRETNCDCERSMEPSLLQTLFVRNDAEALSLIDRRGGWVDSVTRNKGMLETKQVEQLVEQAYLRTLTRRPTDEEMSDSLAYIEESESVTVGLRDVLWALLNTKEFIVNH